MTMGMSNGGVRMMISTSDHVSDHASRKTMIPRMSEMRRKAMIAFAVWPPTNLIAPRGALFGLNSHEPQRALRIDARSREREQRRGDKERSERTADDKGRVRRRRSALDVLVQVHEVGLNRHSLGRSRSCRDLDGDLVNAVYHLVEELGIVRATPSGIRRGQSTTA